MCSSSSTKSPRCAGNSVSRMRNTGDACHAGFRRFPARTITTKVTKDHEGDLSVEDLRDFALISIPNPAAQNRDRCFRNLVEDICAAFYFRFRGRTVGIGMSAGSLAVPLILVGAEGDAVDLA